MQAGIYVTHHDVQHTKMFYERGGRGGEKTKQVLGEKRLSCCDVRAGGARPASPGGPASASLRVAADHPTGPQASPQPHTLQGENDSPPPPPPI